MSFVTWIYIVIEVLSALGLIFLILMHSGKGGGLSDMFGGSVGAAAQGSTVVERNLDRITVTVAIIFTFATLTLGPTPAVTHRGRWPGCVLALAFLAAGCGGAASSSQTTRHLRRRHRWLHLLRDDAAADRVQPEHTGG